MERNNRISEFIKANGLVLVLCVAFTIRLAFYISLQPWNNDVIFSTILLSDAPSYHNLAQSLIHTKSFEYFDGLRTPGYPVFLAIFYSIIPNSIWLALIFQILISLASTYLVYRIASFFFSKNISLLASFLFTIDFVQIVSSVQLMSDTLFVFLFLASILFLCKFLKLNKLNRLIYSALLLGLATLVRPVSYLFPVVVILLFIFILHENYKQKLFFSFLYCFVFVLVLSPWLFRNYNKYGEESLTSISGYNLLFYNVASVESYKTKTPLEKVDQNLYDLSIRKGCEPASAFASFDEAQKNIYKVSRNNGCDPVNPLTSLKNSKIYTKISIDYIKDNFLLYCIRCANGVVYLYSASATGAVLQNFHIFSKYSDYISSHRYTSGFNYKDVFMLMSPVELFITFFGFAFLFANYLFSAYSFAISIKKKDNIRFIVLALFVILYFTALTGIVGASRYRMPFMPFFNILCAAGIAHIYKIFSDKQEMKSL
jgi:4-amino-4-deoxy-L-arabinose transferase-like glycosyltransferase